MFEQNKNKNPESKIKAGSDNNSDVIFHTMQDDLKTTEGKITFEEKDNDVNNQETEFKKERERKSPFFSETFKKPDISAAPTNLTYNKPAMGQPTPITKNPESSSPPEIKKDLGNKKKKKALNFLVPAIIILIIISIVLGSYLLWKNRNFNEVDTNPLIENLVEETGITETSYEKYSSENPNYLSIDTESVSAEDISQLLKETASEIKELKSDGPFEFIVTDVNNNPLSFSVFAYLFKINLSPKTLTNLGENFSLYFYTDNEKVRLGLAVEIQDAKAITSGMSGEESTLVGELKPLFLDNSFLTTKKLFSTGQYENFQIRYVNINEDNTLSVDYLILENHLVIGTSKDTIRVIIDRIIQQNNAAFEVEDSDENIPEDDVDINL